MWCSADTNDTPSAGSMSPAFCRLEKNLKSLRKLDPPMSNWFSSVSQAMDTLSYTIKAGVFTVHRRSMADGFFSFNKTC
jgi:hypothetical protein